MNFRKIIILFSILIFAFAGIYFRATANADFKSGEINSDSVMISHIFPYAVSLEKFGKKEFYSWTTSSQIKGLRDGDDFLSRSESPTKGKALYDIILTDTAFDKFSIATVLRREQYAKKRFAWIDGWATVMGWEGENYGNQLLKITLKDSAIIVAFLPYCEVPDSASGKHFEYEDVNGKKLSQQYVLQHQDQIAAVYFCADKIGSRTQTEGSYRPKKMDSTEIRYREYIICNEEMIAHWEYGTGEIKSEMQKEENMLNELLAYARYNKISSTFYYSFNSDCWYGDNGDLATIYGSYYYLVALPNDFYLFNPKRLQTISATLAKAIPVQGEQIIH